MESSQKKHNVHFDINLAYNMYSMFEANGTLIILVWMDI